MEMVSNQELAVSVLQSIPEYVQWFKEVYKDEKIALENVADAIATFEETLTTPNSRFDWWLSGMCQWKLDTLLMSLVYFPKGYFLFRLINPGSHRQAWRFR